MRIGKIQLIAIFGLLCSSPALADCTTLTSGNHDLGTISSMSLQENGYPTTEFASGLQCSGFSIAALNTTYIKYKITQRPLILKNSVTGEEISLSIHDSSNNVISTGSENNLSSFSIVNLFSTTTGNFPFYITMPAGTNVSPGTYQTVTPLTVTWYYSVPGLALIGVGLFYQSPDFDRGGLFTSFSWGTGVSSSVNLTLTVEADCRIQTNNVSFGTAPLATEFDTVQSTLGVRCSTNTPYSVGLGNGQNYSSAGSQRAMKSTTGSNYLKYELYKGSTTVNRWGNSGSERWSSTAASTNPGIHNGTTQQTYNFTAKVLESNSTSLPAGTYTDNITVDVTF